MARTITNAEIFKKLGRDEEGYYLASGDLTIEGGLPDNTYIKVIGGNLNILGDIGKNCGIIFSGRLNAGNVHSGAVIHGIGEAHLGIIRAGVDIRGVEGSRGLKLVTADSVENGSAIVAEAKGALVWVKQAHRSHINSEGSIIAERVHEAFLSAKQLIATGLSEEGFLDAKTVFTKNEAFALDGDMLARLSPSTVSPMHRWENGELTLKGDVYFQGDLDVPLKVEGNLFVQGNVSSAVSAGGHIIVTDMAKETSKLRTTAGSIFAGAKAPGALLLSHHVTVRESSEGRARS